MLTKILAGIVIALALNSVSEAAEVTCASLEKTELGCPIGLIRGRIEKGDLSKLRTFIYLNFVPSQFVLISPGGDVDESLEIGRLFKQFLIGTVASFNAQADGSLNFAGDSEIEAVCTRRNCICASACALAWLGGIQRFGYVGLHRPYYVDEQHKRMPPAQFGNVPVAVDLGGRRCPP